MYVCVYIRTYTYVSPRLMTTGGGGGGLATKSCLTLATPWTVACQAPPGHGILQARILEWVATSSSK